MDVQILNFEPQYSSYFKSLNYEWIEKYFEVEPNDQFVLEHPEEALLSKGGIIYFASYQNEIVGTCSLTLVDSSIIELGKMAVRPDRQKNGIGKILLQHAITQSKMMNYKVMTLYSNTKLVNAINMYIEFGFRLVPKNDYHSKRANIKMALMLQP